MRRLRRYVGSTVLFSILGVLLALLGLDVVFAFIGELEDLSATYRVIDAAVYSLLTAPRRANELLPIASLIGCLVGLGLLANSSELTVIRASGVSPLRIVWFTLRPASVVVLAGMLLGQFVVPLTEQVAESQRALARGQGGDGQLKGYWHRESGVYIHIGIVQPNGVLNDMSFFRYDQAGNLVLAGKAERAIFQGNHWQLQGVRSTAIAAEGLAQVQERPSAEWQTVLTPAFLRLVTLDPENLSYTSLFQYANYLSSQGLNADNYFLEFWKKVFQPLATIAMVLLASSFIFGPLRSVTMGLRLVTGVFVGLGFRYGQDFFGFASLVYHFSPVWAAAIPALVCFGVGVVALSRVR